jgi:LacI family transcriptional regulator
MADVARQTEIDIGPSRTSLRTVAEQAGVSPATVSKALNNAPDVSPRTRERVRAVARALGYEPSLAAQTMRSRRSRTIGIVTERPLAYQWVAETVSGILDVAAEAGMASLVLLTDRSTNRTAECVAELRRRQVEGLLFVGAGAAPSIRPHLACWDVPHVYTFCQPEDLDAPAVLIDDAQGAALAVRHLVSGGRRRFGLLCGPSASGTALVRAAAARVALEAAGMPVDGSHERSGPWTEEFGWRGMNELLASDPSIDAVIAANDFIALGALHALQQAGRRVPDDVAVVGFDNHLVSSLARPRLTTIAVPTYECGRQACRLLFDGALARGAGASNRPVEMHKAHHVVRLPCTLVVRESSTAAQATPAP